MRLVHNQLLEAALRSPNKVALINDKRRTTYGELITTIIRVEDLFSHEDIRKGDRVLLLLRDNIDFIISAFAIMQAGGIVVPVNESVSEDTICNIAKDCSPFAIMISTKDLNNFPSLRDRLSCRFFLIDKIISDQSNNDISNYDDMHITAKSSCPNENDGALIYYPSNTNQITKGIYYTHRNLVQAALNVIEYNYVENNAHDLMLMSALQPVGFIKIISTLQIGSQIVFPKDIQNPYELVDSIRTHRCNTLSTSTSNVNILCDFAEAIFKPIIHQIHTIHLLGTDISVGQKKRILELYTNSHIVLHYGIWEAPCSISTDLRKEKKKLNTIGKQAESVGLSICDEQGNQVAGETIGDIYLSGDHISSGYWHHNTFIPHLPLQGGWCKSGEIGFLDKDGYIHVMGLQEDIINIGGMKISPWEIEEKIHEMYPEHDICVIGIPDPMNNAGEIPVLCYIPINGKTIIPSELSNTLSKYLDRYKIPRIVYRVNYFPRSENKVIRHELRENLLNGIFQSM